MNAMVGDVMSWTSLTIRPDCVADQALAILSEADAEALFVVDADDRFLGLITGYELLKADLNGTLAESTAEQLMHRRPQTLGPQQSIGEAAKLFREASVSHVPVLRDGRLLGVIERKAVLRWVAAQRRSDAESAIAAPKFLQRAGEISALPAGR
ncbi:MAG TPA: CBS domain-containing protein [Planctomycetaceae bacterium]|nr:CBS domain-containing protein [Planctomycetaceae bacterium]